MKVGDLVQQKARPQGTSLVSELHPSGNWFRAYEWDENVWLLVSGYSVIATTK